MIKEKIIQTAMAFYSRYGIKGVSMSQLANVMSISKRTLYEKFGSKEDLIIGCLEYGKDKLRERLDRTNAQQKSPVEVLTQFGLDVFSHTSSFCSSFYKDITRYPKAANKLDEYKEIFEAECNYYFSKGVEEGYFLPDQNYEFISTLFIKQFQKIKTEHQASITLTLLRGICTDKGLEELKKFTC